jgi:hypothetical protein
MFASNQAQDQRLRAAKRTSMRDYAKLHAIVNARTAGTPCVLCGHGAFRTTARVFRLPLVSEEDDTTESGGPEAMIFACLNCGHIRLFLLQILQELAAEAGNGRPPT